MATKNLIPRSDGEGGIGIPTQAWGDAYFKSGHFLTDLTLEGNPVLTGFTETNDLTNAVIWADVPNTNITQGSVIQHQAALSVTSSQVSDFQSAAEALSGNYKIDSNQVDFSDDIRIFGKVGIGTNDPKRKLHLVTDPVIVLTDDTGDELGLPHHRSIFNNQGGLHFGQYNSDFTSHTSHMAIDVDGNLGIGHFYNNQGHFAPQARLDISGDLRVSGVHVGADEQGRLILGPSGLKIGQVELKPDPDNPESLFFNEIPQVKDAEGNAVTVLTADKLGLGTAAVLTGVDQDITFKLLTDQQRFVVGTTGDYGLESGWYRFNDFKVKGATDIGAHPINPVDTRIYSDETSFILFTTDTAGNRVAHLVGGEEEVSPNNAIALGIAVKVDDGDSPSDIEFVHTDGESYSVINGDSDSLGTNGLPIRQGFQSPSLGSNPSPLLIDGGYF